MGTKTVTLTEDAYGRLRSWKDERLTTFSQVVLAKVPKRGTFADLAAAVDKLPPLGSEEGETLEREIEAANDWSLHEDRWTT